MKQGKTEKAVFAKLSTEKVELALIDDLRARAGAIQKDLSNLSSSGNELADMKRKMQKWCLP